MIGITIRKDGDKTFLNVAESKQNIIRSLELIEGEEYVIDPLNKNHSKNRGRNVIFKGIVETENGIRAKVQYLDNMRPGKVSPGDLNRYSNNAVSQNNCRLTSEFKAPDLVYNSLVPFFQNYIELLQAIDRKSDADNIANVSQQELAQEFSISGTLVSKRIKQLIRYGSIEQIKPAHYKILSFDLWNTPYQDTHLVLDLIKEKPELEGLYKRQAEVLNIPLDDVQRAWGYINSLNKKP